MKRLVALILCFSFLSIPVFAAREEKLVALTLDDGPSGRFTRRLLEGLQQRGVKATFFLCGYRMAQYPALTQRIFQEGHEIGLHGYSHDSMEHMCLEQVRREIQKTEALIPAGCPVTFLRTPGGLCGTCALAAAEDQGLAILSWSVDPKDWAIHDAKAITSAVVNSVKDGDVILLHDMSDSSVDAALAIVDVLQAHGFRFVTASELAQARNLTPLPGKKYCCFPPADPQSPK